MIGYKCPACGRNELKTKDGQLEGSELGQTASPIEGLTVQCECCGWFGTIEDLKPVG